MKPRSAVLVTGSELIRGSRRDSNGPFLAEELTRLGLEPSSIRIVGDEAAELEPAIREGLQADLLTLWGLGRKTIIFVTHDITEAIALGDRALVLSRQPTRIAAEHAIPIPRPRNVQDIFALEGFAAVYQRIRSDIK